jgi:hypothetical protein
VVKIPIIINAVEPPKEGQMWVVPKDKAERTRLGGIECKVTAVKEDHAKENWMVYLVPPRPMDIFHGWYFIDKETGKVRA